MTNSTPFCALPHLHQQPTTEPFQNRTEAGTALAERLQYERPFINPLILGLPRGGVPVACQIGSQLSWPCDIFLVRRFTLPDSPENIGGIVASGGVHILDALLPPYANLEDLQRAISREQTELLRRESAYRQSRMAEQITGRTVIVADDGLTTGFTMRAAVQALKLLHPAKIVVAVPVASAEVCEALEAEVDRVVCCRTPAAFFSVGRCYRDFSPVLDGEIRNLLATMPPRVGIRAFHA